MLCILHCHKSGGARFLRNFDNLGRGHGSKIQMGVYSSQRGFPPGQKISSRPVHHEPLCGRGVLDGVRITTGVVTQKEIWGMDALDGAFHIAPITPLLSPIIAPPHKSHLSPRSPCILFVHPTPPLPRAGGKEELGKPRAHLYIPLGRRPSPPPSSLFIALDGALLGPHCFVRLLSPTRFPRYPIHHE